MMLYYLDSRAWVKRYFEERGSAWVDRLFRTGSSAELLDPGPHRSKGDCGAKSVRGRVDVLDVEGRLIDEYVT
jgi:hypothetical protein